jgi:thiamine biosynthesis lipoprotein
MQLEPGQLRKDVNFHLDLGGIAKGYAVDRAVAALRAQGVRDALVNAGGDLRAIGTRTWTVEAGQRDARTDNGAGAASLRLALVSGAVATSVYRAGITPGHGDTLIDPRRCRRAPVDCVVTVAAPRCVLADALTKVVALSSDAAHPALARFHAVAWLR